MTGEVLAFLRCQGRNFFAVFRDLKHTFVSDVVRAADTAFDVFKLEVVRTDVDLVARRHRDVALQRVRHDHADTDDGNGNTQVRNHHAPPRAGEFEDLAEEIALEVADVFTQRFNEGE